MGEYQEYHGIETEETLALEHNTQGFGKPQGISLESRTNGNISSTFVTCRNIFRKIIVEIVPRL